MEASKAEISAIHMAAEGSWPVVPAERRWGVVGLFGVTLSAGIAAWSYAIGGAVSWYLPAALGTIAMLAGALVGMYFVTLAAMPVSIKYGIDTIAASKPIYGSRGAAFSIFVQYASIIGWNGILIILFGRATANVLQEAGVIGADLNYPLSVVVSLATIAISYFMVIGGADSIRNNSVWIAVAVAVAGGIVLFQLIRQSGWDTIAAGEPAYATGNLQLDYTLGFEILVATVLSWWPYMGGIMRMSRSVRQALWPSMICLGLATGVIGLIGLYASLATGDPDPSISFVKVTGAWMGLVAVVFIGLANVGTAIVGVYATMIGLKQVPAFQFRLSWPMTAAVALGPVALIAGLIPNLFMDNILTFMYFLGVVFAPICAIQIVDYYVFRKQKLHVPSLYDSTCNGRYHFWAGINPVAFVATIVGAVFYWFLLDPVTYENRFVVGDTIVFQWTSASIATIVLSAIVYWILTKAFVIPSRKGGYAVDAA
ncbi:MAG: cytosine permease [Chloroflexi bacterium]|nr:cytosine permease [Chloroflexota bacterium]